MQVLGNFGGIRNPSRVTGSFLDKKSQFECYKLATTIAILPDSEGRTCCTGIEGNCSHITIKTKKPLQKKSLEGRAFILAFVFNAMSVSIAL